MAYFAKLNAFNEITQVIVVDNEDIKDPEGNEHEAIGQLLCFNLTGHRLWKQTSYNGTIRKNFAGVGYKYDAERDAFIPPKPFPSFILNEETCQYEAPIPYPEDGQMHRWDEDNQQWLLVEV